MINRETKRVDVLDAADKTHKGPLKESLGNVNDKMNVNVSHYSEVKINK